MPSGFLLLFISLWLDFQQLQFILFLSDGILTVPLLHLVFDQGILDFSLAMSSDLLLLLRSGAVIRQSKCAFLHLCN